MDNKLVTLVKRLRTRAGSISWEKTDEPQTYESELSGFAVQITESEDAEPLYMIGIFDAEGVLVDEFSDEDLTKIMNQDAPTEPSVMFEAMQDVYRAARRSALGADRAIETILVALGEDALGGEE